MINQLDEQIELFQNQFQLAKEEVAKVIVGYPEIIDGILMGLLAKGHLLLEGIPGVGKTKLVQTLSDALYLRFSRIQFTPDLMPADITGTNMVQVGETGDKFLQFQPGPLFSNVILADEINRATPKTQSALLEAMQEETITVGNETYNLELPFLVMATQNPLEMEGTYQLPEAQMDRFFMKLKIDYPCVKDMHTILNRTTKMKEPEPDRVLNAEQILEMQKTVLLVPIARPVQEYAIRIVLATHPNEGLAHSLTQRYVRYGASPRGVQSLVLGGKIRALLNNRIHVSCEDIRSVALPVLRHRVVLNFEGEAERIDPDSIVTAILKDTPENAG